MTTHVPNAEFAHLASDEQIATTVAALTARGMNAQVLASRAEAHDKVLDLLPEGAEVYTSLSRTLETLGLYEEINTSSRYAPLRPQVDKMDREMRRSRQGRVLLSSPEYVIGSVHAITQQGQVLIASGSGSQLASYVFGASHVIWVVGAQKIVSDLNEGFRRIWEYALPLESERMQALYGAGSFPAKLLLFEREMPGRISLLLVKDVLGF
ncbi:MAG TPA: LUD domain-containing protein [Ktedonobacteraceae bacterium]